MLVSSAEIHNSWIFIFPSIFVFIYSTLIDLQGRKKDVSTCIFSGCSNCYPSLPASFYVLPNFIVKLLFPTTPVLVLKVNFYMLMVCLLRDRCIQLVASSVRSQLRESLCSEYGKIIFSTQSIDYIKALSLQWVCGKAADPT